MEYKCKGNFMDKQGRCLLPANRVKTSDLNRLKERDPYVFSLVKEHAHKQGEEYIHLSVLNLLNDEMPECHDLSFMVRVSCNTPVSR